MTASSPAGRSNRRAYLDFVVLGAAIYGVGAAAPFVRDHLGLSDAQTGLHSTVMAVGLVLAGVSESRLDRRFGPWFVHLVAFGIIGVGWLLLVLSPAYAGTLLAAGAMGLGSGLILGHANTMLGAEGGSIARELLARANLSSMSAAGVVPVFIAGSIGIGLGWQGVVWPAIAVVIVGAAGAGSVAAPKAPDDVPAGRLPADYWRAWLFVAFAVAVEFTIVFWDATLVARRTRVSTASATLVAAAFLAGMVSARLSLSGSRVSGLDPHRLISAGLIVTMCGAGLAWVSTVAPLSALGLFIAGAGVGTLYPIGSALTLEASGGDVALGGARLTIASGAAILIAPFVLGALSDLVGVEIGWGLVALIVAAAMVLGVVVRLDARRRAARKDTLEAGRARRAQVG